MIHIVTEENRHLYHHALMDMHRQRKAIFIDQMRWELNASQGLEIDQFDAPDATYLIEADDRRAPVTGSVRLLRTDRPHLLGDVFPHLCPHGVPRSSNIWEVSRFCPSPDIPKGAPRQKLLAAMIAAIMETCLLFGVERVTFVAGASLAPLALGVGWDADPLGPKIRAGRERVTAIKAEISVEGLRRVRALNGLAGPLTRYLSEALPRAA